MKIGVIGLGNIAQKAYLPIYANHQDNKVYFFATTNNKTKSKLKRQYGFTNFVETIDQLLALDINVCMIHSATVAHYDLAKQCLENGVHVFIDKPLSEVYEEAEALYRLAKEKNCQLFIGFNRRYAPKVQELQKIPNKHIIQLQKNRIASAYEKKFVVYDLFLHLIDTAVFLLNSADIKISHLAIKENEYLEYITLQLETNDTVAIVTMDMCSGANTENYQVTSPTGTFILNNLVAATKITSEGTFHTSFSDWDTTLYKRGFEPMIEAFFESICDFDSAKLAENTLLASHKICKDILSTAK